jgi:hypothetical protein
MEAMQPKLSAPAPAPERLRRLGVDFCRDLARQAGAQFASRPGDLALMIERIRRLVLSDRVAFFLDVSATIEHGAVILRGESERPEFKHLLRTVFGHLGFPRVLDLIGLVPDAKTNPEPFGIVTVPHLLSYAQPGLSGLAMDEALLGEPVYVLKELASACLIKTVSGYWGYAAKSALRRVRKPEFIRQLNAPKVCVLKDMPRDADWIPAGARLPLRHWGRGAHCAATGPVGEALRLPKKSCRRSERAEAMSQVLAHARTYLSAPYNMGGKNSKTGIDCSGLVQMSYRAIGVNLPRDAKQQYLGGHLILPCVAEAMQPGDAMFFMADNGQVDHTALYVGRGRAIHATGRQVVKIQDLDPASPNHLRRYPQDFIGAKRFWW